MKVYMNGIRILSGNASLPLSGINDTNCWLGRSQFSSDAYFFGSYQEFRIFSGLLSDSDVAAEYSAGPDALGVDYVLHGYPSTNGLKITWGLSVTNRVLQTSSSLGAKASWKSNSTPVTVQNGRYSVVVPSTNDAAYFRLH